jgi:hypothetical protein
VGSAYAASRCGAPRPELLLVRGRVEGSDAGNVMTTNRDVKRPEAKLVPAYPLCGTCPYALVHGLREDGSEILKCHGYGAQLYPVFTGTGFEVHVGYPETRHDRIGSEKHPLWPEELRKPFLNGRPKKD